MNQLILLKKVFFRVSSIPRISYAIYNFEKAWKLVAEKRFVDAEKLFEKGEKYIKSLPYEYKIIKGRIKFNLNKRKECIFLLKEAWEELEKDNMISLEEKLYLKEYISDAFKVYDKFFSYDKGNVKFIDIKNIDLSKVHQRIRKTFPSRNHPDWNKYSE